MAKKTDKGAGAKPVKPEEYQRFEEVLKKVIKAPPMRHSNKLPTTISDKPAV
jgi:hypothetical protein